MFRSIVNGSLIFWLNHRDKRVTERESERDEEQRKGVGDKGRKSGSVNVV